jgi:ribonuclease R
MKNYFKTKGTISITSLGSGYVSVNDLKEDIYIPFQFLNRALNGDEVEVVIHPKVKGEKTKGEVISVISRKKTRFVGVVEKNQKGNFCFVIPDDHKFYVPIFVSDSLGVANGMKVLVELTNWNDSRKNPNGKILKVIGKKGDNDTEMESIVIEKGFGIEFPDKTKKEIDQISKKRESIGREVKKRKDFRDTFTFTIDPDDAKDFDDAISFKKINNNLFEVGIHIADVSYWVKEKSQIDKEAKKRGFSVYLVDRTIPMLPEILSNDICSLSSEKDKLAFSAVFQISSNGDVRGRWFGKTIIKSDKRFTYKEAQDVIDSKKKSPYSEQLKDLMRLALILRKKRVSNGALEIGQDEIQIELDSSGKPVNIYVKKGMQSQQLIEEFMVLANKEVAVYVGGKNNKGLCVYRIHEKPDRESLNELFFFLRKIGYNIKISGSNATSKELNDLLTKIKGKEEEFLVKSVLVRSLPKAIYSITNKGHFAMALTHYAHFTSPIRRYADLLVHRVLDKKIEGKPTTNSEKAFYRETSEKLSQREIDSSSAERESTALKQVEYMLSRPKETRKGIISGITEWGIYIQDIETRSEGLVRLKDMKGDFYVLNKENFSITGQRTKKKYSLGDKVKFKVSGGDLEKKSLDYIFV